VDEPADVRTFRIGLLGIDKLRDVDATLKRFTDVADLVL
jgi:aspartate aminotransferase-like enzyme